MFGNPAFPHQFGICSIFKVTGLYCVVAQSGIYKIPLLTRYFYRFQGCFGAQTLEMIWDCLESIWFEVYGRLTTQKTIEITLWDRDFLRDLENPDLSHDAIQTSDFKDAIYRYVDNISPYSINSKSLSRGSPSLNPGFVLAFVCWRLHHAVDIAFMKSLARKQFFHCLGSEFWCQYKTVCANASAQVALSASSKARIFRKNWSTHDVFFELYSYYSNRLSKSSTWNTHPQPELKLVTAPIIGLLDKFSIASGWKTHF